MPFFFQHALDCDWRCRQGLFQTCQAVGMCVMEKADPITDSNERPRARSRSWPARPCDVALLCSLLTGAWPGPAAAVSRPCRIAATCCCKFGESQSVSHASNNIDSSQMLSNASAGHSRSRRGAVRRRSGHGPAGRANFKRSRRCAFRSSRPAGRPEAKSTGFSISLLMLIA